MRKHSFWDILLGPTKPATSPSSQEGIGDDRVSETVSALRDARRRKAEMSRAFGDIAHDMRTEADAIRRDSDRTK